jgi:hypothetical protein
MNTFTGCTTADYYQIANNIYASPEYNNLQYTNLEKAITLYRGILNREPNNTEVNSIANGLGSQSISYYVNQLVNTTEFFNLVNTKICTIAGSKSDSVYRWGTTPAVTVNTGETPMSAVYLQGLLDAAKGQPDPTVRLPQHAVVYADRNIVIPAGVTLTTNGSVSRVQYAKMARIVRTSNFATPIITIKSGGSLNGIWVSGQRDHIVNGTALTYSTWASSVLLESGSGSSVVGSRIDTPAGNTNIGVEGEESAGIPCANIQIQNNLITGYSNTHYPVSGAYLVSDGITVKCVATTLSSNTIIDASDVGIVIFYAYGTTQKQQSSAATGNLVISSGVPAYAAYMFEPYYSLQAPPKHYNFTGANINGNSFWSATDTHFDIGISVGGKAWRSNGDTGKNAAANNNSNEGIATNMQIGIGVDGMTDTNVSGNALSYVQLPSGVGVCGSKSAIIADTKTETGIEDGVQKPILQATTALIVNNSHPYTVGDANACQMGTH